MTIGTLEEIVTAAPPLETDLPGTPTLEEEILAELEMVESGAPLPRGKFITFEGCEGAGKSTQMKAIVEWLEAQSIPVLATHEPGGTPLGVSIRSIFLDKDAACCPLSELFLMLADRAQHVSEVIQPSLGEGVMVLCDRYNDSTLAYQAGAGGLSAEEISEACALATGGLQPDLTVLLDVDPVVGFERVKRPFDRMEKRGLAFHQDVRETFLRLARQEPERFLVIDASAAAEEITQQIQSAIQKLCQSGHPI